MKDYFYVSIEKFTDFCFSSAENINCKLHNHYFPYLWGIPQLFPPAAGNFAAIESWAFICIQIINMKVKDQNITCKEIWPLTSIIPRLLHPSPAGIFLEIFPCYNLIYMCHLKITRKQFHSPYSSFEDYWGIQVSTKKININKIQNQTTTKP